MLFQFGGFQGVFSILPFSSAAPLPRFSKSIFKLLLNCRVPSDMPLYDILNEFQKGSSHMAAVVKVKGKSKALPPTLDGEEFEDNKASGAESQLTAPLLRKHDENSDSVVLDIDRTSKTSGISRQPSYRRNDASSINGLSHSSEDIEDGEVIGIITLEDVFEELLQAKNHLPHLFGIMMLPIILTYAVTFLY